MSMRFLISALIGLAVADNVVADSSKMYWQGHYYQRFDKYGITWPQAKVACLGLGAHLATISSSGENDFIFSGVAGRGYYGFAIGATDELVEGTWQWVTGEAWPFEKWGNIGWNSDYLAMNEETGKWDGVYDSYSLSGLVCEWDGKAVVAVATVKDLDGNGVAENAVLYRDDNGYAHKVVIRDPVTKKTT